MIQYRERPNVRKWIIKFIAANPHISLEDLARRYWMDQSGCRHNLFCTDGRRSQARKMLQEKEALSEQSNIIEEAMGSRIRTHKDTAGDSTETKAARASRRKRTPIVKGFVSLSGIPTFTFWCPFCRDTHSHGWPESSLKPDKYAQHRRPHCHVVGSPFKKDGYFLQPFTAKEIGEMLQ